MRKTFLTSAAVLMAMSGVAMAQPTGNQALPSHQATNPYGSALISSNGARVSSNGGIQYGIGLVEAQPLEQPGVPNGIELPHPLGTQDGGGRG